MIVQYKNIAIRGIQSAVPSSVIDNYDFTDQIGEKNMRRFMKMVGVQRRHVLRGDITVTSLAVQSAAILLERLMWSPDEIRVLVYVTQSPEFESPSTAMLIHKQLGLGEKCIAFDVNLGCSGYVAGLQIVAGLLQGCQNGEKALLLTADDAFLSRKDFRDGMLFGDGAAATAIEKEENAPGFCGIQRSDGNRYGVLLRPFGENVFMDGEAVFEFSQKDVTKEIRDLRDYFSIQEEEIDYYVFHQAQKYMINYMVKDLNIPNEKVLYSLEEYGNTSCAAIPLTLCANQKQINKDNIHLLLCGFGVGLSWGSLYLTLPKSVIGTIEEING